MENIQNKWKGDLINKEITFSIKWHNRALEYAKTLESCFSPYLFFTVGLNVIILSLCGIQTLNSIGSLDQTVKFGAFMFACLIHLYCISLPAQNLLDCSIDVTKEAYDGNWYLIPMKSKKLFIIFMIRGQISCKLTAGKICTMDMVSFSALVKTSVSYFTVLSSMRT